MIISVGAIGIEPGDEVICSPYSMSASATSVLFYGGIPIFADLCDREYANSRLASQQLTSNIVQQIQEYNIDSNLGRETRSNIKKKRLDYEKKQLEEIRKQMNKEQLRANDLAQLVKRREYKINTKKYAFI